MPESKSGALPLGDSPAETLRLSPSPHRPRCSHYRRESRRADVARVYGRDTPSICGAGSAAITRRARRARLRTRRTRTRPSRSSAPAGPGRDSAASACAHRRESRTRRRLRDRCGRNPRKRRLFSPTASNVSIPAPRRSPRSTRARAACASASHCTRQRDRRERFADAARDPRARRRRRTARRRRASAPSVSEPRRGSRSAHSRLSASSTLAASELPPPSPAPDRDALFDARCRRPARVPEARLRARALRGREIVARPARPATSRTRTIARRRDA